MATEFVGSVIAFKGEEEYLDATPVLVEIVEQTGSKIEIAFDLPVKNGQRIYLTFSVMDLLSRMLEGGA